MFWDIRIFNSEEIWVKGFPKLQQILFFFNYRISYLYLSLPIEQCFINSNTTSLHFSKYTSQLIVVAEMMLQLAEQSSQSLTDHWAGLKYISGIAGSKACVLRTWRSARHRYISQYCKALLFHLVYWGYLQVRSWLGFVYLSLNDSQKASPFFLRFCCFFQHINIWGLFSLLFLLCLISFSSLMHLFHTDGYFTSVHSMKFNMRHLYRDKASPLINLRSKLDSHTAQNIWPLIIDSLLQSHVGKEKFFLNTIWFKIFVLSHRTHQIALSCIQPKLLKTVSYLFLFFFVFPLKKF